MAELPDFPNEVIARALAALKEEIPPGLYEDLQDLVKSKRFLAAGSLLKAIAKEADKEPTCAD